MSEKVGFVGAGIMGVPMCLNLLRAGVDLCVYNRTAEKARPLVDAGAASVSRPRELADWADVVVLMLTGPEAIDAILHGPGGLLEGEMAGKVLVNMSTVLPAYTRRLDGELASRSVTLIDAPVSGSKKPAEDATLLILAGGPRERVEALEPLLLRMGKKVVYCGEAGQGSSMKMTVNLLLGIMMEGLCEAVNLGRRCDLDLQSILDTLLSGPLGCGLFNLKVDMLKNNDYPAQFPFKHMAKDIRFVLQTADEAGAAAPLGNALFQLYRHGLGQGLGDLDFAAVQRVLEGLSDR